MILNLMKIGKILQQLEFFDIYPLLYFLNI